MSHAKTEVLRCLFDTLWLSDPGTEAWIGHLEAVGRQMFRMTGNSRNQTLLHVVASSVNWLCKAIRRVEASFRQGRHVVRRRGEGVQRQG